MRDDEQRPAQKWGNNGCELNGLETVALMSAAGIGQKVAGAFMVLVAEDG